MNSEFRKPYLAEIYGVPAKQRRFVYSRETLIENDIFPFYVLDGGAFFFMNEIFGTTKSSDLLELTMSGKIFDPLRKANGEIDWERSYNLTDGTGLARRHELQSWAQRLYILLPLAQEFMRTHDKKYSHEWLRILRTWIDASPYEPLDPSTPHVKTTMKWRDMQVSWRTMVLVHSIYMLGTYDDAFEYAEWKYIYDFLELNLNHLMDETTDAIKTRRYGNHILQMSSALISAGVLMPEFPNAYKYMEQGCEMMMLCEEHKILSDGASSETCPSYCHFIARLYFEAEMHLEFNGYPQMQGMRDSVIRQYRWMAETSTRDGRTIRFNDSYDMDAHTDIRRMAEIGGFDVEFPTGSVCKEVSGYVHLRGRRLEAALDAMDWFGGHQHFGRLQPMLWVDGKEILTEVGCTNYDNWDSFNWCKLNEAHSVIYSTSIEDKQASRTVKVTNFDAAKQTVTAVTEVKANDGRSYTWERTLKLADSFLDIEDKVSASEEMEFNGNFYLSARPTAMLDKFNARQVTDTALITLTCDMPMTLDRVPCLDGHNKQSYVARLQYKQTAKEFTVITRIDCAERVL